jgi:hypothetical protein
MIRSNILLLITTMLFACPAFATTWDEPWQDSVIRNADYFVFAKVKSFDEKKGVTIEILKSLGGPALEGKIKISDFYLLDLCSNTEGHSAEFRFGSIDESYFFIKKNKKGDYCIATPTTGFDYLKDGNVYATYRHSYHQALVPKGIYEKTMLAVFNSYHNLPYDKAYISEFVSKYTSLKPAGFAENEISTFFAQHVALECIYHLRLTDHYSRILPFLADTSNFHNQVSAARALIAYNTPESRQELLKVVSDTSRGHFVQVMCIRTLSEFKPAELKEQLRKAKENASSEDNGFGGNLMDPRICTHLPTVKEAMEELIKTL